METTGIVPTPGENYGQKEGTYHFRSVSFFCVVHEMSSPNTNTEFISLMGIPQFAIIGLPPFHLFCSYFLLLQIDNSTLWRKNCSYVRKAEQVSQGIHGQVQGQQRKLIVISNWELVFCWVSLYFFSCTFNSFHGQFKEHCAPITELLQHSCTCCILLVFSVTPFKIDQNKK